ncbi:hypothetical protein [Mesorhizobium sp.]|uniref:hypothetical protein n=1 Tax=Mesorhizobium sp. TaxID=1871066 RepID=UPI000FE3B660|nr:hypothetical protein [Mesorhizobium sp.]RWJ03442.1 MAG: hypothetical protein EOR24_32185 [Mesorhizobium sp.]
MARYVSPKGHDIVGTYERVYGVAQISDITDAGEPVYAGGTRLDWDSQETLTRNGTRIFLDEAGGEWTFDQLAKVEESEDA